MRRFLRLAAAVLLAAPAPLAAQGGGPGTLPPQAQLSPLTASRSGLYLPTFQAPRTGWQLTTWLEYGNISDYKVRTTRPSEVLVDMEAYRFTLAARRDVGRAAFVQLDAGVTGAWGGVFDGFLTAYHRLINYEKDDRKLRPHGAYAHTIATPDGRRLTVEPDGIALADTRLSAGVRWTGWLQSVASVTLPTSTAPDGFRRGVATGSVLTTARALPHRDLALELSAAAGYSPARGELAAWQEEGFYAFSAGVRWRAFKGTSAYGTLYYHSPVYAGTGNVLADRQEFTTDFGLMFRTRGGRDWWVGLGENLSAEDPAMDLVLRVGTRW